MGLKRKKFPQIMATCKKRARQKGGGVKKRVHRRKHNGGKKGEQRPERERKKPVDNLN